MSDCERPLVHLCVDFLWEFVCMCESVYKCTWVCEWNIMYIWEYVKCMGFWTCEWMCKGECILECACDCVRLSVWVWEL